MLVVAVNWPPEMLIVPVEVLAMMAVAAVPETPVPKSTVRLASMIAVPLAVGTAPLDQLLPTFQVPDATFQVTISPRAGRNAAPLARSVSTTTQQSADPRPASRLRRKKFITWRFVGRRFCRPCQRTPAAINALNVARGFPWEGEKRECDPALVRPSPSKPPRCRKKAIEP